MAQVDADVAVLELLGHFPQMVGLFFGQANLDDVGVTCAFVFGGTACISVGW